MPGSQQALVVDRVLAHRLGLLLSDEEVGVTEPVGAPVDEPWDRKVQLPADASFLNPPDHPVID